MAASPTPKKPDLSRCVAVACSGGRDSVALLHATWQASRAQGVSVWGFHVHHGLSAHADAWQDHVQQLCDGWGLEFRFRRLRGRPLKSESVEAWARRERYRALGEMAVQAGVEVVLLAHHRRDQAETLLLQALRGAGVAGLAGMPARIERDGITWVRPWLDRSRESIDNYVALHRLRHVDDDSNADPRFARNRLRSAVWPALSEAFPQAEASLADAARWAQEAAQCLHELADHDLGGCTRGDALMLSAWRTLSDARRVNALRTWLHRQGGAAAPSSLVQRLMAELDGVGPAQWPWGDARLHRHRGQLRFVAEGTVATEGLPREERLSIVRAGAYRLPGWGGQIVAVPVQQGGVPLAWLGHLELRSREGGEQFQAGIGRPPRSLKKQFQAADVPSWQRDGPLVYSGGQLVFVPGLGVDARVWALPGQAQFRLDWQTG